MTEALGLLRQVEADLEEDGAVAEQNAMASLIGRGERIQQDLLDHLHKQARPGTGPDLMTMFHQIQRWNADWQRLMMSIMAGAN